MLQLLVLSVLTGAGLVSVQADGPFWVVMGGCNIQFNSVVAFIKVTSFGDYYIIKTNNAMGSKMYPCTGQPVHDYDPVTHVGVFFFPGSNNWFQMDYKTGSITSAPVTSGFPAWSKFAYTSSSLNGLARVSSYNGASYCNHGCLAFATQALPGSISYLAALPYSQEVALKPFFDVENNRYITVTTTGLTSQTCDRGDSLDVNCVTVVDAGSGAIMSSAVLSDNLQFLTAGAFDSNVAGVGWVNKSVCSSAQPNNYAWMEVDLSDGSQYGFVDCLQFSTTPYPRLTVGAFDKYSMYFVGMGQDPSGMAGQPGLWEFHSSGMATSSCHFKGITTALNLALDEINVWSVDYDSGLSVFHTQGEAEG